MKLTDRVAALKDEVTSTPEGKRKGMKLAAAGGCFLLAFVVLAVRLVGGSDEPVTDEVRVDAKLVSEVQEMAEELEDATAEETAAYEEAIASGEVEPPEDQGPIERPHGPKGIGYLPGSRPAPEPEPEPGGQPTEEPGMPPAASPPVPEPEDPDDGG